MTKRRHSFHGRACLLLVVLMVACGGGAADAPAGAAEALEAAEAAEAAQAGEDVQPAAGRSGTVELAGMTHEFQMVRCDLTGTRYDGMLIHGSGVQPDGRRMSVQVERVDDDGRVSENVFVSFGSLMDGDVWTAGAHRVPDGRWFRDERMMEPVEGPLLAIAGSDLSAAVTFIRETDATERAGVLHASCPAGP
jgi:hypothetical protein